MILLVVCQLSCELGRKTGLEIWATQSLEMVFSLIVSDKPFSRWRILTTASRFVCWRQGVVSWTGTHHPFGGFSQAKVAASSIMPGTGIRS